jgi:hypothetical protein
MISIYIIIIYIILKGSLIIHYIYFLNYKKYINILYLQKQDKKISQQRA